MNNHFDRIVIGGGVMGISATWQLAERDSHVLMLEQFEPGHRKGSSHGATRNFNNGYTIDHYLDLLADSEALWRKLETCTGRHLLQLTGMISHGGENRICAAYDSLVARGNDVSLLSPLDAERSWSGMRFSGPVLVNRDAGRINAADGLEAIEQSARNAGAVLRYGHQVINIQPGTECVEVTVRKTDGNCVIFSAEEIVVAVGAWSAKMLDGLIDLPKLTVTEEHPAHFTVRADFAEARWPSFNHYIYDLGENEGNQGNVYGMFTPGEGVKVGFHHTGEQVDPDARQFKVSDEDRTKMREYVTEWFPGLDPDSAVDVSCTYTSTSSERFVLDKRNRVTVAAGFSGHGFKFAPGVGRVLADLSLYGIPSHEAFMLTSH